MSVDWKIFWLDVGRWLSRGLIVTAVIVTCWACGVSLISSWQKPDLINADNEARQLQFINDLSTRCKGELTIQASITGKKETPISVTCATDRRWKE